MKCKKDIVLTGYRVQYVDLREPKPKTIHEETHVAESAWIKACGLLGVIPADRLRDWYKKHGYKVISIETVKTKRKIVLDLCQLWEAATPSVSEYEGGTQDDC